MKEKLKNATTAAEISRIIGLGDADVQKLSLDDLDGISGGGHFYTDSAGQKLWVQLMDDGYVFGTDTLYDYAYILEGMASAGMRVDDIIGTACKLFEGATPEDVRRALLAGGTAYLADCYREAGGSGTKHFSW